MNSCVFVKGSNHLVLELFNQGTKKWHIILSWIEIVFFQPKIYSYELAFQQCGPELMGFLKISISKVYEFLES